MAGAESGAGAAMGKKNVVVLLIDTARAKDVNGSASLPTINSFARNGTSYRNVVAPGTWTGAVHASLFTDKRVSDIPGVSQNFFENGSYKIDPWMVKTKFLAEDADTIARKLSRQGYATALLSNNPFLNSYTNLALGFDTVFDLWKVSTIKHNKALVDKVSGILNGGARARMSMYNASHLIASLLPGPLVDMLYLNLRIRLDRKIADVDGTNGLDKGASATNRALRGYLKGYGGMPHFMFINFMEAHENYPTQEEVLPDKWLYLSGIKPLEPEMTRKLHDAYLKRIRYLDGQLSKTLSIMRESGFLDNATVIVTSDHGQFFGEHGLLYHSMFPYDEVTKVPLLAANFENGRMVRDPEAIDTPVSLLSLHSAILDLASGREERLNGNMRSTRYVRSEHTGIIEGWDESLLRMLKKKSRYASMIYAAKERFNEPVTATYFKGHKLLHFRNRSELYHLESDPDESCNILDRNRSLAKAMLKGGSSG